MIETGAGPRSFGISVERTKPPDPSAFRRRIRRPNFICPVRGPAAGRGERRHLPGRLGPLGHRLDLQPADKGGHLGGHRAPARVVRVAHEEVAVELEHVDRQP